MHRKLTARSSWSRRFWKTSSPPHVGRSDSARFSQEFRAFCCAGNRNAATCSPPLYKGGSGGGTSVVRLVMQDSVRTYRQSQQCHYSKSWQHFTPPTPPYKGGEPRFASLRLGNIANIERLTPDARLSRLCWKSTTNPPQYGAREIGGRAWLPLTSINHAFEDCTTHVDHWSHHR